MAKEMLHDDELDQVNGGFMHFNRDSNVLTYTHEETGQVTTYQVLNFDKAWEESNRLHAECYHEDYIIKYLKYYGYIG